MAGFNLGILMRNLIGKGTPKEYAEVKVRLIAVLSRFISTVGALLTFLRSGGHHNLTIPPNYIFLELTHQNFSVRRIGTFSPGC